MKEYTASKIAEFLLQIKAIKLQPDEPFTWVSGWKSPIYCDNRIALSHPKIRTYIRQELVKTIEEKFGRPDIIAGVATAAIAQGVLVAEAMGLPFVYVRPSPKEHGRKNLIEGEVHPSQSAVVIEDLISTGKSSLLAVDALRESKVIVKGMVSIFTYGFPIASEMIQKAGITYYPLTDYPTLIQLAAEKQIISSDQQEILLKWQTDPAGWKGVL